ncbi:FAD-binding domain-containing protein [Gellertiella hungarica]|uniref:Deoxyribodipyrimidine photo-lyase n=1 Tax=Gellertiella hungarica TaxID=1572859 RepID=A0A7W6J3A9_9HYPH|nr:FAD-binding domain-containing protein [Gellertiella hungarica]MBB4063989.1 deoxyribodipyrimidine photo-lyase [Gellertiella hungarica]
METGFPLNRADALHRLKSFLPQAGSAYARLRNRDEGPGGHRHVSRLSASLRRRLVSEEEVVRAVLGHHDLASAEKFVSEVFWRSYWKGWLEQRPSMWQGYRTALSRARARLDDKPELKARHEMAVQGRTGIDYFDACITELAETGYLHNWSRMQIASIWIFTLNLPWELGADLFFERLLDADPASNTLSWRWVAGLHTVGKAYLADPERIRAMTDGRFAPKGLARSAVIPADSISTPPPSGIRERRSPDRAAPTLLLVTTEDLSMEEIPALRALPVRAIACVDGKNRWDGAPLADGMERARQAWPGARDLGALDPAGVFEAAAEAGCTQVTSTFIPAGPVADALLPRLQEPKSHGIVFTEHLRDWDRRTWPHCRKGFFALKEKIPGIVEGGRA